MEFFVKTADIQRAIKLLSVTAKMNVVTYEGRLLITASEDGVHLLSNNGVSGITNFIPAKVVAPGELSVVYSKIKSFIMTFQPWDGESGVSEFHFIEKADKLSIKSVFKHSNGSESKNSLRVDTLKNSNIPKISLIKEPTMILNSSVVKTAIDRVVYALDPKGSVVFMTGICMSFTEDFIKFAATGGKMLCEYKVENDCGLKEGAYLLTHEFIMGLRRVIVDDTQLFWEVGPRVAKVDFDNILYQGQVLKILHKDDYPNYECRFSMFEHSIDIDRDIILSGLSSFVDILSGDDFNRVSLSIKDKVLLLKTESSVFEYASESFDDKIDVTIDLDGKAVLNTLYAMSDKEVRIKFIDSANGVVFESLGFDKQQAYIVNLIRR